MLSSENTVLVDGMLSWEVIGERVVIMSSLELLEIFIDVVLFGEVVEIFVIVVVLLSVGVAGMRVVVVMLSMEVAWISLLVMIVGEVDVRILVIDVRPSTNVMVVFCEAGYIFGEVAGVLLIVVKLSVELPLDVVELICGVVIVCCVVVIICRGVVLIPGDVIFCTGIL